MLTCHLRLKMKSKTTSILDKQIIREDKILTNFVCRKPTLSGVYIQHILIAFCHLPISFVLFTHSFIDSPNMLKSD